ncbi:hypothetical protein HYH03_009123 [Edaphochlamys debaryana]|uniref:Uncharacterized protein n=1 Tax=Edaphochlamys debaryana TaxID=47281 RepID=A0A835Y572_9CHLO|nr:hypothetical protein HYH03_009123 [Edaphochlamys debaryana]|eukprot:KAG2492710.1 hypothetical protein HYH03_009123 [Edaphochlamys debaryana]
MRLAAALPAGPGARAPVTLLRPRPGCIAGPRPLLPTGLHRVGRLGGQPRGRASCSHGGPEPRRPSGPEAGGAAPQPHPGDPRSTRPLTGLLTLALRTAAAAAATVCGLRVMWVDGCLEVMRFGGAMALGAVLVLLVTRAACSTARLLWPTCLAWFKPREAAAASAAASAAAAAASAAGAAVQREPPAVKRRLGKTTAALNRLTREARVARSKAAAKEADLAAALADAEQMHAAAERMLAAAQRQLAEAAEREAALAGELAETERQLRAALAEAEERLKGAQQELRKLRTAAGLAAGESEASAGSRLSHEVRPQATLAEVRQRQTAAELELATAKQPLAAAAQREAALTAALAEAEQQRAAAERDAAATKKQLAEARQDLTAVATGAAAAAERLMAAAGMEAPSPPELHPDARSPPPPSPPPPPPPAVMPSPASIDWEVGYGDTDLTLAAQRCGAAAQRVAGALLQLPHLSEPLRRRYCWPLEHLRAPDTGPGPGTAPAAPSLASLEPPLLAHALLHWLDCNVWRDPLSWLPAELPTAHAQQAGLPQCSVGPGATARRWHGVMAALEQHATAEELGAEEVAAGDAGAEVAWRRACTTELAGGSGAAEADAVADAVDSIAFTLAQALLRARRRGAGAGDGGGELQAGPEGEGEGEGEGEARALAQRLRLHALAWRALALGLMAPAAHPLLRPTLPKLAAARPASAASAEVQGPRWEPIPEAGSNGDGGGCGCGRFEVLRVEPLEPRARSRGPKGGSFVLAASRPGLAFVPPPGGAPADGGQAAAVWVVPEQVVAWREP